MQQEQEVYLARSLMLFGRQKTTSLGFFQSKVTARTLAFVKYLPVKIPPGALHIRADYTNKSYTTINGNTVQVQ